MAISNNSAFILRKLRSLGEVELADLVKGVTDFSAKDCVNSLIKNDFISVTKILVRKSDSEEKPAVKNVKILTVSEKGLRELGKQKRTPIKVSKPKIDSTTTEKKGANQDLHQTQTYVIPERNPDVEVDYIEIDGRKVKITYGRSFTGSVYIPPKDLTRYKPSVIRGINAG